MERMTPNPIYIQDEILQVMYWMKEEDGIETFGLADLNRFLKIEEVALPVYVEQLVVKGLLTYASESGCKGGFRLTVSGIEQGKRRFTEEFEPYRGHGGHFECNDPNCDCHSPNGDHHCMHDAPKH